MENLFFVGITLIATATITFLSSKGALYDKRFKGFKKLKKRGWAVLGLNLVILLCLFSQEYRQREINRKLKFEQSYRDSVITKGIAKGTDSIYNLLAEIFKEQDIRLGELQNLSKDQIAFNTTFFNQLNRNLFYDDIRNLSIVLKLSDTIEFKNSKKYFFSTHLFKKTNVPYLHSIRTNLRIMHYEGNGLGRTNHTLNSYISTPDYRGKVDMSYAGTTITGNDKIIVFSICLKNSKLLPLKRIGDFNNYGLTIFVPKEFGESFKSFEIFANYGYEANTALRLFKSSIKNDSWSTSKLETLLINENTNTEIQEFVEFKTDIQLDAKKVKIVPVNLEKFVNPIK